MPHISDLKHDSKNPRRHTSRNVGMIQESLQRFGGLRGIVIDENGTVLAGNGVLEAAAQAGIEDVEVIDHDGSKLVAIRVSHLSAEEKAQYAVADNRTTDLSEWDVPMLSSLADDGVDLSSFFFDEEWDKLLASIDPDPDESKGETDLWEGRFEVVVECDSEAQQQEIYDRLSAEGLSCRVLSM